MAIQRRDYKKELAIGKRTKATVVASLDAITEGAELLADTVTTARSTMELIHGSLQPAIAEQKIEYAVTIQKGIDQLVELGMDKQTATNYLDAQFASRPVEPEPKSQSVLLNQQGS